jgi:hypothetical protein
MSVEIVNNTITMTRGDTLRTPVGIFLRDGTEYEIQNGDTLRFALRPAGLNAKETAFRHDVVLVKSIPVNTLILELVPADTKELPFGKYKYDVELVMADGTTDTIIENETLTLSPEVY